MNSPEVPQQEQVQENQDRPMWIRQILKNVHWRIHATLPNIIKSPHNEDRNYLEQHAREKNEETRISESERLRHSTVWGVEIFGPAEIESFYRQIRKLGWDKPQGQRLGKGVTDTIKEWRTYGLIGNFNIGVVRSRETSGFQHTYIGPVPKDAEYLLVNIIQFTPEITCVTAGFVFGEAAAQAYERELCKDRKYEHRAIFGKFSYSTWSPKLLKRESIDAERARCRKIVTSWFKNNFRGFFYSASMGERLPTAELITCQNEFILTNPTPIAPRSPWCELLVPHGWGDVWINTKYPGFRLRCSDPGDDMPFHSIVSLQTSSLPEQEFEMYGGVTDGATVAFVHERIEDFLCQNAGLSILHEIGGMIKNSRERLKTGSTRYKKILKSIDDIKTFFDGSIGFPVVLSGIQEKAKTAGAYKWRGNDFSNEPWPEGQAPVQLSESIRLYTLGLSKRVITDEVATREHLEQLVGILSARESVKTQRRMEFLAYLTVSLALGSLVVSLSPDSWVKETKTYIDSKFKNE